MEDALAQQKMENPRRKQYYFVYEAVPNEKGQWVSQKIWRVKTPE